MGPEKGLLLKGVRYTESRSAPGEGHSVLNDRETSEANDIHMELRPTYLLKL